MQVVEKLAPHFEIKLAADFFPSRVDVLRLELNVFLAIKPDLMRHCALLSLARIPRVQPRKIYDA